MFDENNVVLLNIGNGLLMGKIHINFMIVNMPHRSKLHFKMK